MCLLSIALYSKTKQKHSSYHKDYLVINTPNCVRYKATLVLKPLVTITTANHAKTYIPVFH